MSQIKIPPSIDHLITEALAIEAEEAKEAGALGFMARAMVQATLPHKHQRPGDQLTLREVAMDGDLYRAMRALRETQEWRLKRQASPDIELEAEVIA